MGPRHRLTAMCCTALALAAPPVLAGTPAGTGAETLGEAVDLASELEWSALDREIAALAQANEAADAPSGIRVDAVLRTNYAWFDESPTLGPEDYSGFALDNVRPRIDGALGDYSFQIEIEAQSGTALVLDAYAAWNVTEAVNLTMGRFQPAFLRSALVDPENLLFVLRTLPAQLLQERDEGVQVAGRWGNFLVRGSLENGNDGVGDDYAYTARLDWDVLGGGVRLVEGAYGSGRDACLTVAGAYHDDANAPDEGDLVAVDAALTLGRFAVSGEWLQIGEDPAFFGDFSDTSPFAVMASFMIDPERYEVAVRFEKFDADDELEAWTLGLNRYVAGHDLKWVLNVADVKADRDDQDGAAVALGLTVHV
jgi:hypothetical protein